MAIDLPKELWLTVLCYLDYCDLKRCMGVSKTIKSLVQHSSLDKTLFRSNAVIPAKGAIALDDVRIHPAFDLISFECATKIEHAYFMVDDYERDVALSDTPAAKEQATDPAVAVLRLQIHDWPPVEVKNKKGVTVVQVMKALCRFFAKDDNRECMGDHTGWTGWDDKRLDSSGRLVLKAMWFDS